MKWGRKSHGEVQKGGTSVRWVCGIHQVLGERQVLFIIITILSAAVSSLIWGLPDAERTAAQ